MAGTRGTSRANVAKKAPQMLVQLSPLAARGASTPLEHTDDLNMIASMNRGAVNILQLETDRLLAEMQEKIEAIDSLISGIGKPHVKFTVRRRSEAGQEPSRKTERSSIEG